MDFHITPHLIISYTLPTHNTLKHAYKMFHND
uniref:Uncharacterized protein n=1 Tax=Anguilla anguilla TaxID=7936 RepID=A0A0E9PDP1_ANGAN